MTQSFDDVVGHYKWMNYAKQNEIQQKFPAECVGSKNPDCKADLI